jgi:hypothetical protein
MRTRIFAAALVLAALAGSCACKKELVAYQSGDIKIHVEKGEAWLHDFPLFMGIELKNPPQIAIWTEDMSGNYLSTIYVTHRIAAEAWRSNKGNRRKEALPAWSYARGVRYPDGLYLPTKDEPLVDGISGATPKGSFDVKIRPEGGPGQFVVKVELNQSTDWNENYPKDAKEGEAGYSGGEEGSGQPAVVYSAAIDLSSPAKSYTATLSGHSSPDGTDGEIVPDTSSLTSALKITNGITITIE